MKEYVFYNASDDKFFTLPAEYVYYFFGYRDAHEEYSDEPFHVTCLGEL